jgi:hypothetical protein
MGKRLIIASKEFHDLAGNRIIFVAIGLFLFFVLGQLWNINEYMHDGSFEKIVKLPFEDPAMEVVEMMLGQYTAILTRYGAIMAIAVGFLSIADERRSGALNTLVVKPVQRDAIITGKMMGALAFLLCVFAAATFVLTIGLIAICGYAIVPLIGDYAARVPLGIITALLYAEIFLFSSMLISLIVRDYAFALIFSLIVWSFSELLTISSFAGKIAHILGMTDGIGNPIVGVSPDGIVENMTYQALIDFTIDLGTCIDRMTESALMLALYALLLMTASYLVFNRRDVA